MLSSNPNITIEFIKQNLNKNWGWISLSRNPAIKLQDIIDNPNLPWNYNTMSSNPNITLNFVYRNIDKNWNWEELSRNKLEYDTKIKENIIQIKQLLQKYCIKDLNNIIIQYFED